MDTNKRFDQIESLLVDLARKVDQQGEQIAQIITELNRQGEAISRQAEAIGRQTEAIGRQGEAIGRQGEAIGGLGEAIGGLGEAIGRQGGAIGGLGEAFQRQEKLLTIVSKQADGIVDFLKLSTTRQGDIERQQVEILLEVQRLGKRTDASVEAIKLLFKRQDATSTRLDGIVETQIQMLQLQRLDADKIDYLAGRLPAAEGQEPRIKRLEDEVFRAAS